MREFIISFIVVGDQSLSPVWLFATPLTAACQPSLSFTISWSLLKLMSIEWMMPSNHLICCHSSLLLPSVFPSIRDISSVSAFHIMWLKFWTFSFSISPSSEYSGLISLTTIQKHKFFSTNLSLWSNSHIHTWPQKTIDFTRRTFVSKVMTLLSNTPSRFVITLLPIQFSLVIQSCLNLWPHGLQHNRLPCSSPTPRAYPNSCPSSWWCRPTISSSVIPLSSFLQSFPASGSFPSISPLHQVTKVLEFSLSISPSNEYSRLISFRMDWLDLLAIQQALKSLLQHHSSRASILWCSAFFIVQLSHPYITTGKNIALTRWVFFSKVVSLLFNMLSRLDITFLPRSTCL